ncbi:hypothetical protein AX15_002357 [Amanita polypyramis BW_CC]|nr:hypothetical protein AX15_002357 [Amanita polypyramis BW_CC]
MDVTHPLRTLLQLHLASDVSAATHLSDALALLNEECFLPSPHLTKWTARINSLLHSKEACGRWAGLCLAYRTSECSKTLMVDYAQGWLSVALPLLSKNESFPVMKASICLLYKIFSGAMDASEFQRQVSIPNVPKMTAAMIALAEKQTDPEFKVFILSVISKTLYLYPNLHRASYSMLSSLALDNLDGSTIGPTDASILDAASQLYVVLHFTGGKVNGPNLWRKSVEDTISFGWKAFYALRTTFPMVQAVNITASTGGNDPLLAIPLNLDRLRCCVVVLRDLFRTPVQRPVQLPLGLLVKFITGLMTCSNESQVEGHVDANIRAMEVAAVPETWRMGCQILTNLATCVRHHLTPHMPRLISCLTIHLEREPKAALRLVCLEALQAILIHCHPLDSDLLPNRLVKSILPLLTIIFSHPSGPSKANDRIPFMRKGKKRNRNLEGDEILKTTREILCPTAEDELSLLTALEVLKRLWQNPNLSAQMQSVLARSLIALHLSLPRFPRALLSVNPSFHAQLSKKIQDNVLEISSGTSNISGRSLRLIATFLDSDSETQQQIDLLIHPRVPPLIRREPLVQSLASYYSEELPEEASIGVELKSTTPQDLSSDVSNELLHKTSPVTPLEIQRMTTEPPVSGSLVNQQEYEASLVRPQSTDTQEANHTIVSQTNRSQLHSARTQLQPIATPLVQSVEDEEMPSIDMASDTDDSDI